MLIEVFSLGGVVEEEGEGEQRKLRR